jgi:hypothetical protein
VTETENTNADPATGSAPEPRLSMETVSSRSPESYERLASPSLRAAWLLRTCALASVASTVLGALVVPGLRGLASDAIITRWELISAALAHAMGLLLAGLLLTGAFDLSRTRKVGYVSRAFLFLGAPGVLAMLVPAFARALTPIGSLILASATLLVVAGGAISGLRAPHTRALAIAQIVLAFAGLSRLLAWVIATLLADSVRAYTVARTFSTAGILSEGLAQMLVVAWLSTRKRMSSSIATALALVGAFMVVWLAGRADVASPTWQLVLRAGIHGQVTPGGGGPLNALEAFFITASVLLALACTFMRGHVAVILCALALALLGRGAFDVPLRALAASVAALWTTLAAVDDRAMWRSLKNQI